jgi:hypothetical protein
MAMATVPGADARRWLFPFALGVSIVATTLPVLATRYFPSTDIPEHVAVIATLRHWRDPVFSGPYELNALRSQYLLYHLAGALVSLVIPDAELANRLLLACVGAAFPLAFRALLRAAGRDPRLSLFACLPFLGRPLVLGFLPFLASIPLLFGGLALVFRQKKEPSRRRFVALALLALALFYTHVSAWLLLVLSSVFVTFALSRPFRRWPRVVRDLAWLAPSGLAASLWFVLGKVTLEGRSLSEAGEIGTMRLERSLHALPLWLFDIWRSHGDEAAAVCWWAAFAVVGVISIRRGLSRLPARSLLALYAPLACAVFAYALTPYRVGAAGMLNVRLAPVVALFAILPLRLGRGHAGVVALAAAVIANVVGGATATFEARRAVREEFADIDTIFRAMRDGGRLITLHFAQRAGIVNILPGLHIGSYHRARGGGVASFSFSELHHWPLHYREGSRPPRKPRLWWELDPCVFRNAEDGAYFDYVLVQGSVDPFQDRPPGPVFVPLARAATYTLYGKTADAPWPRWESEDRGPCVRRAEIDGDRRGSSQSSP